MPASRRWAWRRTTFGLIPIFGNDVWLHALTALLAAYFGFATRERVMTTTTTATTTEERRGV